MSLWNIHTLDVWGNKKDGFEINDVFTTGATLLLSDDDVTDTAVIKALKKEQWLRPRLRITSFYVEQHENDIYISYLGKPCLQLRKEK